MSENVDNVQQLPLVPSVAFQSFDTVLINTPYQVKVRWNTRDGAWYLSLSDAAGDPIFSGAKIVIGTVIGRRVTDPRLTGFFWAVDLGASGGVSADATFDDFGTRVVVYFYPFAEWFS